MKVLHILNELKHSGAEVMLQSAYECFKGSGIDSHILSTGDEVGDYAAILQHTGYKIHHIPFRRSAGFFIDVGLLMKKETFTVIHIHTERAFIWYAFLAKMSGARTTVRTFHNVFMFSGYLRWKRLIQRFISRRVLHSIHIAIGSSVQIVEGERFRNDCILIPNWTDMQRFRPPTIQEQLRARKLYHLEPDEFSIVTIGACTPVKNHNAILSALKAVNNHLDMKKVVLLHVGAGSLLEEEKLYARENGIEMFCRFIGSMNDVRPALHAADAFVMTSDWEGLPIAAVEAMSTGLPAILYDVYGLRDLLQNGQGGLLVDPNEDSLVKGLFSMIYSSELRKTKAQEARQIILSKHSVENSVQKLIRIYTTGSPS